jgi:hypothetical protein
MGYLNEVNNELLAFLTEHIIPVTEEDGAPTGDYVVKAGDEFREKLLKYVKGKILESYKNGIEAAKRPPQGKVSQPRIVKKETTTKRV